MSSKAIVTFNVKLKNSHFKSQNKKANNFGNTIVVTSLGFNGTFETNLEWKCKNNSF